MNPDCWVKSCNFLSQITFCMKIGLLKFFLMHLLFTITGINVGNGKRYVLKNGFILYELFFYNYT